MVHSFSMKLKDVADALEKARNAISSKNGSFDGNNSNGTFSGSGVVGNYSVVSNDEVKITIEKKPFIASNGMIEKEIKKFFAC